ncbi:hypothetical protein [Aurantiacibacter gangjinensis]|uniref:Uncharacterized protein n=1 Tax=Aurantiacibacter gangjinensis TaxID=502682 RepID=A0A0G9MK87_9SPHN|nr:hypothetical protein [Aurantiacibacter gangjinensis]APE29357.1 hypothetical protein BMF35_b0102 [Aurantiacibacter gangjinensis]KLE31064.1 hypothetical protein AAW01_12490 [Aurantiacibacter gangjinensis]
MRRVATLTAVALGLSLAACYPDRSPEEPEEAPDTEFEESVTSPLPEGGDEDGPVPDNDSIEGGADEATDEAFSGENMVPEDVAE